MDIRIASKDPGNLERLLDPIRRHVTPYRFCWGLVLVCFLIAWNRGIAMLYAVVSLALAALALSHLLSWMNLRGVRVRRDKLRPVDPGQPPVLHYRVRAPGVRHFLRIHEPALTRDSPLMVAQLDRQASVERPLSGLTRGVYPLGDLEVSTAYPFGLLERTRVVHQKPQELVVHPRWFEVQALPSPRPGSRTALSEMLVSRARGWDEFAGVREWRPGEGLKHVHWRASARQDRLMLREYDALDTPAMLIVLPQQPGFETGVPPHSCFEYAIEIAVSLAFAAARAGYAVHCLSDGRHRDHFELHAGLDQLAPALEWFARLQAEGTTALELAIERACATVKNAGWLVTFRDADSAPPATGGAFCHLDYVFDSASFEQTEQPPAARPASPVAHGMRYFVSRNNPPAAVLS